MSKLKYAMAMIVAGGAAGAASQAAAAVKVETFNFAGPTDGEWFEHPITLAGALAPQFNYNGGFQLDEDEFGTYVTVKHHLDAKGTARLNPNSFSVFSLPDLGEDFSSQRVTTFDKGRLVDDAEGDTYYHLKFDSGPKTYLGTATITSDHTLTEVAYTAGVPEPESWALLVLGAGLAGATLRRARREQRQLAIAR